MAIAAVLPGTSPIVRKTKVKRKTTSQNLEFHQAMSLVVSGTHVYEVAAGVTATHQKSDAEMFVLAKQHPDAFLGGLRIKARQPRRIRTNGARGGRGGTCPCTGRSGSHAS